MGLIMKTNFASFFLLRHLALALVLLFSADITQAGGRRDNDRDGERVQEQRRGDGAGFFQENRQKDGGNGPSNSDNQYNGASQSRHNSKMTPDERRALRRQINEAGHDIYTPRR